MRSANDKVLFWASFLTLIAAGIGFSVRGAILGDWGRQFGFTQTELGTITGGGLIGFGITIIVLGFFADRVGYGPLMGLAFLLHTLSAVVTFAATPVFNAGGMFGLSARDSAYWCLNIGMWLFALGNGTCEAVINPLTATLFPKNKTHWLNILHAGWPGGLVLGALIVYGFNNLVPGGTDVRWEYKLGVFLVPVLLYGLLMAGRRFPRSETSASGVSMATMALTVLSPILLFLFLLHAMVGFVELGTDSWITNITETVLDNQNLALLAFIWTNILMFTLRFFAGPIVHQISPVGLLFGSACVGTLGLWMLGQPFSNTIAMWMLAVTIYGVGKTFYWPTMLGVISECYPKGGALALGLSGGIGMISAGLLGAPGIGYMQDFAASHYLKDRDSAAFRRFAGEETQPFPFLPPVTGLNNARVGVLKDDGKKLAAELQLRPDDRNLEKLNAWWQQARSDASQDRAPVQAATLHGGKQALEWTAVVPAMMAVGYLLLLLYFKATGGYRAQVLVGHRAEDEEFTGGTIGPGEG